MFSIKNYIRFAQVIFLIILISQFCKEYCNHKHLTEKSRERYYDFVNQNFYGIVVRSFIDKENHNVPMIVLKDEKGNQTEFNFVNASNGEFIVGNIHVSDSIFKRKGSDIIYDKYNSACPLQEFKVSYDCKP